MYAVSEAVSRLEDLGRLLSEGRQRDGLRHFNRLYLRVTSLIELRLGDPDYFLDKPFLETLDVRFANRYLSAVGSEMNDEPVPWPWKKLFDRRGAAGVLRLQFAAAGVNAHITFDLAQALVDTWKDHPPADGDHQRHDYDKVNDIFDRLYAPIRQDLNEWIGKIDSGRVTKALDAASRLLVTSTRCHAWEDAEEIARLRRAGKWLEASWKVASMGFTAAGLNVALLTPFG